MLPPSREYAEALAAARQSGVPSVAVGALHLFGILDYWQGDYTATRERFDKVIGRCRR